MVLLPCSIAANHTCGGVLNLAAVPAAVTLTGAPGVNMPGGPSVGTARRPPAAGDAGLEPCLLEEFQYNINPELGELCLCL
jgi:hypothetical protein